ncbi:uncharacterized protein FIBRA_03250 [Fibroporia radiculosa]|uniref:Cytochrome P450 n=1 Tax=Fibroporia radiculosa TaxID=599839 RepID=J4HVW1_9APHY|nr:uncharacterized protein FIBRA_03250 [Fibroporia radiculosa]CCM01202.1 predicted protein [Fibroporia radiculosa]
MITLSALSLLDCAVVALTVILLKNVITGKRKGALPPGPKGWPIIGNALGMPTSHHWKTFTEWSEKWGEMTSFTIFGQPMVMLNSLEHAVELLNRRSTLYSDRPILLVAGKLVGWDQVITLAPYGAQHREHRRLLSRWAGTRSSVMRFAPIFEREVTKMIVRLAHQPDGLVEELKKMAGAIILDITYGYRVQNDDDPLVRVVDLAAANFSELTTPGACLADTFPILNYVPAWMPGAGWKRRAFAAARDTHSMLEIPYAMVMEQMAAGSAIHSFTSDSLEEKSSEEHHNNVKSAAGVMYAAGAATSVATMHSFFLAMICFPEVQKKAQLEIEAVVGTDRLPTLADRDSLPFVNALCTELHRWNPALPLGVTHRLIEDDVYEGYHFPKGTLFTVNVWKILHDSVNYKDPLEFNPDRFIASGEKESELDPRNVMFGFGRRVCTGIHLADATLFMACTRTLAIFNLSKPIENGRVIEPVVEYQTGTISHPPLFKCAITPRSAKAEALLHSLEVEALQE